MESLILNQFKKLEDQHKSNIFNKIYESNFTNLYAGLLALCAIHIPIIILDYLKLKKGMWEINLGYKYIFFMHLGLYGFLFFSLSFYLFLKKYNYSFKTKNVFCFVVSLLLQLWSALFSSIDQMIFGDISIFYISIFCLPVFFKFRAELEFFKLALAEIAFILLIFFFQSIPDKAEGIIVNSGVAIVLAFVASRVSFSFKLRELASHAIILQQKEELYSEKEKSKEAARNKNEFITSLSHELQNQMRGLIGILKLLDETKLNHEQKDYTNLLDSSVKSLLSFISDIFEFTQIESGKTELENNIFYLPDFIKKIISISSSQASLNDNIIKYYIEDNVPKYISGDKIRLSHIILNLLSNAIKFTKSGTIELIVSKVRDNKNLCLLEFQIKDTGSGIEESRLDKIFDLITKEELSNLKKFRPTGLSLAISKKLITMMGGNIAVESVRGAGSNFHFTFPTENHDDSQKKEDTIIEKGTLKEETIRDSDLSRKMNLKILLVDDNEINLKLGKKVFEKLKYEVSTASDGKEAVELCNSKQFDIVLMDLYMPVLNG
ncbi:MAG TPA: ATP-binding protein, partial [Leptospiraceae bacterium]|nr:ATP-binding protein [Leptospiraceae bacterium]